ncbi:dehydrogenase/reductase-like and signal peptide-containing protein [Cryptosporidium canis]|uniref:Dehydrogenase/reductase-like and signal peptide-containing protein n=1 Tax=Cryptosporidium canis TaxID=195482 RepID=A0A9D5DMW1_9CRYT|nr:dehydrogenase/reductase-like and signal peptide-containing protein [Cryptosporidium canis]
MNLNTLHFNFQAIDMRKVLRIILNAYGLALSAILAVPTLAWGLLVTLISKNSDFNLGCLSDDISPEYFKDKVVWITGASSGIGKAIALMLAKLSKESNVSVFLILTSRSADQLNQIKDEIVEKYEFPESNVLVLDFDLGDLTVIDSNVDKAKNWKGQIHILYNNAGIGQRAIIGGFESDEKVMMINSLGSMKISKQVLLKCFIPQRSGHLINTLSVQSYIVLPGRCAYGASKRSCLSFFQSLRKELKYINWDEYLEYNFAGDKKESVSPATHLGNPNIIVTNIYPGHIQTDFDSRNVLYDGSLNTGIHKKKGMTAEQCSDLMIKATTNLLEEAWIAKGHELLFLYLEYYSPSVADAIQSFVDQGFTDKIWEIQKSHLKKSS